MIPTSNRCTMDKNCADSDGSSWFGNGNRLKRREMLCFKVLSTKHVASRRHSGVRAAGHCLDLYRSYWGLHWLSGLWAIQQALSMPRFDVQKRKKVAVIACGYLDGVFGWFGTFEHRQPYIAAFSKRTRRRHIAIDGSWSVRVTGERL
jgi:hypothetical protein